MAVGRAEQKLDGNIVQGLAAGILAGLAASYAMNAFQSAISRRQRSEPQPEPRRTQGYNDADPATARAASILSENAFRHRLSPRQKDVAGPVVHYAVGAALGGLYGVAAELEPRVTTGAGLPFGAAVAAVLDEGIVPAAGLSGPPWESSASTHLYSLGSHLVFGLTAEVVRRSVRSLST
ncbi:MULTISPECIES: DUF1440 domain-containing protein [Microvirga]|uniref:DUF1440 domain-containing protein n=1 Tax=Microvirga TaxID=186650 RepID=UPI001CFE7710|nr:DUF1440 domain-containing protein [Microvirga lenta]MCB5173957.1 DUF1440 domain-containing protein [Microvirga lenta]